jgi:3-hydroxyisobutyrate dehydrogenase
MKALNNLLSAVGLAAACEVIAAGVDFGLDPATMLAVLNRSTGKNNATETKVAQFVLSETFASGFGLRLMVKDLRTAVDLIRSEGLDTPIAQANLLLWERAALELPDDADHTMVAKTIGRRAT